MYIKTALQPRQIAKQCTRYNPQNHTLYTKPVHNLDHMLITDQNQIAEAISQIIGEESYVSLRRTDFDQLCPHPACALHVTAPTPRPPAGAAGA